MCIATQLTIGTIYSKTLNVHQKLCCQIYFIASCNISISWPTVNFSGTSYVYGLSVFKLGTHQPPADPHLIALSRKSVCVFVYVCVLVYVCVCPPPRLLNKSKGHYFYPGQLHLLKMYVGFHVGPAFYFSPANAKYQSTGAM